MHYSLDEEKLTIDFVAEIYFAILNPRMMAKLKNWACADQHPHTALWWWPTSWHLCIDTRGRQLGTPGAVQVWWPRRKRSLQIFCSLASLCAPHLYHTAWVLIISRPPPHWPASYLWTRPCHLHLVHPVPTLHKCPVPVECVTSVWRKGCLTEAECGWVIVPNSSKIRELCGSWIVFVTHPQLSWSSGSCSPGTWSLGTCTLDPL